MVSTLLGPNKGEANPQQSTSKKRAKVQQNHENEIEYEVENENGFEMVQQSQKLNRRAAPHGPPILHLSTYRFVISIKKLRKIEKTSCQLPDPAL